MAHSEVTACATLVNSGTSTKRVFERDEDDVHFNHDEEVQRVNGVRETMFLVSWSSECPDRNKPTREGLKGSKDR